MDSWLNGDEKKIRKRERGKRERERALAESSGIDVICWNNWIKQSCINGWFGQSTLVFTFILFSVTNRLSLCLKYLSYYFAWVPNEKWQALPAHIFVTSDVHTFSYRKKKNVYVLTKCLDYKLLSFRPYIYKYLSVCVCVYYYALYTWTT